MKYKRREKYAVSVSIANLPKTTFTPGDKTAAWRTKVDAIRRHLIWGPVSSVTIGRAARRASPIVEHKHQDCTISIAASLNDEGHNYGLTF